VIDEYNADRTGWARLSDDRVMRYRLSRSLRNQPIAEMLSRLLPGEFIGKRVVFLMLNPSTADAFVLDPTVNECRKRAIALGADVLEVVNLFALRSPYPADLRKRAHGFRGDDAVNDLAIIDACTGAHLVIAAWGNHGALDHRDTVVRSLLRERGTVLHHLGTTQDGYPKHPLARGKHRIAADFVPQQWSV